MPETPTVRSENKLSSEKKPEKTLIHNGLCLKNKPCVSSAKGITTDTKPGLKLQNASSGKQVEKVKSSSQNDTSAGRSPSKTNLLLNGTSLHVKQAMTKVSSLNGDKSQDNVSLPQDEKTKRLIENNRVSCDNRKTNSLPQNSSCSSQSPEKPKLLSQNGVCSEKKPASATALLQNGLSSHKRPGDAMSLSQNGVSNSVVAKKRERSSSPSLLFSNLKCEFC